MELEYCLKLAGNFYPNLRVEMEHFVAARRTHRCNFHYNCNKSLTVFELHRELLFLPEQVVSLKVLLIARDDQILNNPSIQRSQWMKPVELSQQYCPLRPHLHHSRNCDLAVLN